MSERRPIIDHRSQGRHRQHDALIAAIVLVTGATLATRDFTDFEGLGLTLIDPWATESS